MIIIWSCQVTLTLNQTIGLKPANQPDNNLSNFLYKYKLIPTRVVPQLNKNTYESVRLYSKDKTYSMAKKKL